MVLVSIKKVVPSGGDSTGLAQSSISQSTPTSGKHNANDTTTITTTNKNTSVNNDVDNARHNTGIGVS